MQEPKTRGAASVRDLDLAKDEDFAELKRRLAALAGPRLLAERARLEKLGIIDKDGNRIPRDTVPPDMRPDSDTSVETG